MPGVAFFVCGTPSNNRGFELVELGPAKLPGAPGSYLDKAPADAAESHRIESLSIDGQRYVQYSRVLRINPNDVEANRGAYIAVGCLIRERQALHTVTSCLDAVTELFGRVCARLTPDRSFPRGFRLADLEIDGLPLEEKTAHECSPLLVADVLLQALNAEGPIDWPNAREVVLAPDEMTATDVGRYQFYSRQGSLGSLASVDFDRARVQHTAQRATAAAQALTELQREWAALEGIAERLLTKAQAFQHLTLEMERGVKQDRVLDGARRGRSDGAAPARGSMLHEREPSKAAALRMGPQRGRVSRATHRRGSVPRHAAWLPAPGWPRVVALVLGAGFVAVLAIVGAQRFLPRLAEPPPPHVVASPEPPAESPAAEPQSDVARERAALDAPAND
jgi:hypothetical protein